MQCVLKMSVSTPIRQNRCDTNPYEPRLKQNVFRCQIVPVPEVLRDVGSVEDLVTLLDGLLVRRTEFVDWCGCHASRPPHAARRVPATPRRASMYVNQS